MSLIQISRIFFIPFFILFFTFSTVSYAQTQSIENSSSHSVDFIYVNSNIGESAGGHTALRLGDYVFHYQFFSDGHFLLVRDSWDQFLFFYHSLFNRSIYLASLTLNEQHYRQIKSHFTSLLVEQQKSLNALKSDQESKAFINELMAEHPALQIPRLGLFEQTPLQQKSKVMIGLKDIIKHRFEPLFLARQKQQLKKELLALSASLTDRYVLDKLQNKLSFYAGLQILEQANTLNQTAIFRPLTNEAPLNNTEQAVLQHYVQQLEQSILSLLISSRPDKGTALLLQIARYQIVSLSLQQGRLITLDPFAEQVKSVAINDEERKILDTIYFHLQDNAELQRRIFFSEKKHFSIAWSLLESSRGRFYELHQGIKKKQNVRLSSGILIPSRMASFSLSDFSLSDLTVNKEELLALRDRSDKKQAQQRMQVQEKFSYNLSQRNCATELLKAVNSAFRNSQEIEQVLGAFLTPGENLNFIPFVFYQKILSAYPIAKTQIILSRRLEGLDELYKNSQNSNLAIWWRENNTLSSTLYKARAEDTPFIFFTDDTLIWRPLFGTINFSYALFYAAKGFVTLPIDHGDALYNASRGIFFSLPELLFWNIRKGSYGYTKLSVSDGSP